MKQKTSTKPCTLASIAELAGVSKVTVSRVLNNMGSASRETRERIFEIARVHCYVPNLKFRHLGRLAGSNEQSKAENLGLLLHPCDVREFSLNPYYGRLFWSIESATGALGKHLAVSTLKDDPDQYLVKMVADQKVDGILVADAIDPAIVSRIGAVMPVVLVNSTIEGSSSPSIMPDEASGVRQALAHLRELGHSKITFFYIADSALPNMNHILRARAFRTLAMEGPNRDSGARTVILPGRAKSLEDTLYDQLREWLAKGEMPTAILCAADTYAVAFIEAARRLELSVPGDLSIIGTDDTLPCEYVRPRLTSIRQPLEAMGAAGVKTLIERIEAQSAPEEKVTLLFDVTLVKRDSCAPCRDDGFRSKTC